MLVCLYGEFDGGNLQVEPKHRAHGQILHSEEEQAGLRQHAGPGAHLVIKQGQQSLALIVNPPRDNDQ